MTKVTVKTVPCISSSALTYLTKLKRNNNREWFNAGKQAFLKEQHTIEIFADGLLTALHTHDLIETPSGRKSLHRIYRDTRFSNNKIPYKVNWSGSFKRATTLRRGGYYYHIEPGNSFIAGGFWGPGPEDLKRIRDDIAFDALPLRKIIGHKKFIAMFGTLQGERLKTAPKGFDAGDAAIDLLRYKQFLLIRRFTDNEVLDENFLLAASETFKSMRPFFDYMSEVLSSGINGVPV